MEVKSDAGSSSESGALGPLFANFPDSLHFYNQNMRLWRFFLEY